VIRISKTDSAQKRGCASPAPGDVLIVKRQKTKFLNRTDTKWKISWFH